MNLVLYVWVLSDVVSTLCDYRVIHVGFKRFFCWQCVNMLLYVWVLRGFLLAMCDSAAIRVGFKRCSVKYV